MTYTDLRVAAEAVLAATGGHTADAPEPVIINGDTDESTGWEATDIAGVIAGGCHIPPPALYHRCDGVSLLYPGKLHALNGEPESGKSWVAQHAAVQVVASGVDVCYIDFEDSPESVIGRMLSLGAKPADLINRLTYIGPDRPLTIEAGDTLRARFAEHRPALVAIDGVTEAMSIMGLDPLDNAQTAKWFRLLPRRFARYGSAVVMVDHVVKDREERGRWAIGSQHKMAALTGAAYTVDAVQPFGRNKAGFARITVTKDRPGYIRQHAVGGTVAELHLTSTGDDVTAELRAPKAAGEGGFRPTVKMQYISEVLHHTKALSKNALYAAAGKGRREAFQLALETLINEGYVGTQRQGQTVYHYPLRPFPDENGNGGDDGPF